MSNYSVRQENTDPLIKLRDTFPRLPSTKVINGLCTLRDITESDKSLNETTRYLKLLCVKIQNDTMLTETVQVFLCPFITLRLTERNVAMFNC